MADPKHFKRGGGRKTIYQLRPHLSQMRTTKYMPFTWKKRLFVKKNEPIGEGKGALPPPPLEFATGKDKRSQCIKRLNLCTNHTLNSEYVCSVRCYHMHTFMSMSRRCRYARCINFSRNRALHQARPAQPWHNHVFPLRLPSDKMCEELHSARGHIRTV